MLNRGLRGSERLQLRVAAPWVIALTIAALPVEVSPAAASPGATSTSATCPTFPGAGGFVSRIDNRYLPLVPGSAYTYQGQEGGEKQSTVVEVTDDSKTILGVAAVVVRDTVKDNQGGLVELTLDWFAQDTAGNVWYLGEDTKEFENGQVVSTEGSWEAGVNGAQPGIIMEAQPRAGDAYKQECAPPGAVDEAAVEGLNAVAKTPYGSFGHVLRTRETTPLEPGVAENKFYVPCLGMVRTVIIRGGHESTALVDVQGAPSPAELGCSANSHHKHRHKHRRHSRHR